MAFCGKCGQPIQDGDAFCRACGAAAVLEAVPAQEATPPPPPSAPVAAPAQAPPAPSAPSELPAPARRFPAWAGVLIGVLVLLLVGGAAGGYYVFTQWRGGSTEISSADPGSLGFDAEPFDPNATVAVSDNSGFEEPSATEEPVATNPEPPAEEPVAQEPVDLAGLVPAAQLTKEDAVDAVGSMLNYMHQGKEKQALALTTKNMLGDVNNDKTWFSPGPDILISFEVQDATRKGEGMKVRVLEQWNSGPERTTYTVVLTDGKAKVDGIAWSSW